MKLVALILLLTSSVFASDGINLTMHFANFAEASFGLHPSDGADPHLETGGDETLPVQSTNTYSWSWSCSDGAADLDFEGSTYHTLECGSNLEEWIIIEVDSSIHVYGSEGAWLTALDEYADILRPEPVKKFWLGIITYFGFWIFGLKLRIVGKIRSHSIGEE